MTLKTPESHRLSEALGGELEQIARSLRTSVSRMKARPEWTAMNRLRDKALEVARAWSGSSIGYHARIYFSGLAVPPPGAHFSSEWGLFRSSPRGEDDEGWREYGHDEVIDEISNRAGSPDLTPLEQDAVDLSAQFDDARSEVESILSVAVARHPDSYLSTLLEKAKALKPLTFDRAIAAQLPHGQVASRDSLAAGQGLTSAPHQVILARVSAIGDSASISEDLAAIAERAARHQSRAVPDDARAQRDATIATRGGRVFIGHGRAAAWRELKDFVKDRLNLETDEFSRTPTAGVSHTERL